MTAPLPFCATRTHRLILATLLGAPHNVRELCWLRPRIGSMEWLRQCAKDLWQAGLLDRDGERGPRYSINAAGREYCAAHGITREETKP